MINNPKYYPAKLATIQATVMKFFEAKKKMLLIVATSLLAGLGIALFIWGTSTHGIGIRTDSVTYLWSAKNLGSGIGLGTLDAFGKFKPLIHFPPLYPIVLAPFAALKIDPMTGARWLGALFIGSLVVLSIVIVHRLTERSFWLPVLGICVLIFMVSFWDTMMYAMTEPLYLAFSLAGMICIDNYIITNRRWWLLLAAILFSLSFLTRYIGFSVIATGLLMLLIQKVKSLRRKAEDLILLGAIGILPMAAWLIRNELLANSATNRTLQFVQISAQEWRSTLVYLFTWIEPIRAVIKINLLYLVILVIALGSAYLIYARKSENNPKNETYLPRFLALYAGIYLILTIGSRLLVDPNIPLYEDRILLPCLTAVFFLVLRGLHFLLEYLRKRSSLLAVFTAGFLVMAGWGYIRSNSSATFPYVRPVLQSHEDGLGLQFRPYLVDSFQLAISQLPADTVFFTDNVEKLYFYTTKPSSYIGDLTTANFEMLRTQLPISKVAVVFIDSGADIQKVLLTQIPQFHEVFRDDGGRVIDLGTPIP